MLLSPVAAGRYQSGFGNGFATEAIDGALPRDQNSPQRAPLGLYAEQLSGTAFTAPRAENRRSWLYRIRPPAAHGRYEPATFDRVRSAPLDDAIAGPNRLRWDATPLPAAEADFVDGLTTLAACGNVNLGCGAAVHVYAANRSMERRVFSNADGEMLFVPHDGALELVTELGRLAVAPGEMAVIPRGIRFRVELAGASARGYCCENYGALWRLPELGPIGANGLANARDFLTPVAAFEDDDAQTDVVHKYAGRLWRTQLAHSPLDVVAWHGNYAPYVYNLAAFNTINSVSYDHPDPSIFTVLTSPSDRPGTANVDFVVFPPRWTVAEHTFRPPWFHRNVMSEFMGLVRGRYDGKAGGGFVPGGASLHNGMSAHGPDAVTFERASDATLVPQRIDESLAIMFETALRLIPTAAALASPALQSDYDSVWNGLRRQFPGA